jgi:hypothetical protein
MFDPLSTQFSAVQRESHQGRLGQQAHDEQTYTVLYGDGSERPRRRLWRPALVLTVLGGLGALLVWLARF